jgi:hypothetical protein
MLVRGEKCVCVIVEGVEVVSVRRVRVFGVSVWCVCSQRGRMRSVALRKWVEVEWDIEIEIELKLKWNGHL